MSQSKDSITIHVLPNGDTVSLYHDDIADMGGVTERASRVEPCDSGWAVEVFDGPLVFGFPTRGEALAWEKEFIEERLWAQDVPGSDNPVEMKCQIT